ncbi:MAG: hypothetical protein A3K65_04220 [Euryarchaeota archaeon RBG_16_68_12]|nr:MAG: hypothetical protein A3K65_04220 [Euryarchaeota archaeon RBG_16_68_12]
MCQDRREATGARARIFGRFSVRGERADHAGENTAAVAASTIRSAALRPAYIYAFTQYVSAGGTCWGLISAPSTFTSESVGASAPISVMNQAGTATKAGLPFVDVLR